MVRGWLVVQTNFRCSDEERESYHEAARRDGFSKTADWLRAVANDAVVNGRGGKIKPEEKTPFPSNRPEQFLLRGVLLVWEAMRRQIEANGRPEEVDDIRAKVADLMGRLVPGTGEGV